MPSPSCRASRDFLTWATRPPPLCEQPPVPISCRAHPLSTSAPGPPPFVRAALGRVAAPACPSPISLRGGGIVGRSSRCNRRQPDLYKCYRPSRGNIVRPVLRAPGAGSRVGATGRLLGPGNSGSRKGRSAAVLSWRPLYLCNNKN